MQFIRSQLIPLQQVIVHKIIESVNSIVEISQAHEEIKQAASVEIVIDRYIADTVDTIISIE
jgi:hypothetical protein